MSANALSQHLKAVDHLVMQRSAVELRVEHTRSELQAALDELTVIDQCALAFEVLLTKTGEASLQRVEQLITFGLRTVFTDMALSFKFIVEQKRGGLSLEPVLVDELRGVTAPILAAHGGGPGQVVSLLLRVLVCKQLGLAPVLLLDEPLHFVSRQYRAPVGKLLRELAEQAGLTLIMVSHEPEYVQFAHHAYEAMDTAQGTTFKEVR